MSKKKRYYTVLFVPEGSEKTISLHVYRHILYSLVLFIAVFFVGFTGLVIKSGEIAAKLHRVSALKIENQRLKKENSKLEYVKSKLDTIEAWGEYLQRIAVATNSDDGTITEESLLTDTTVMLGEDDAQPRNYAVEYKPYDFYSYTIRPKSILGTLFDAIPTILPTNGWITRGFYQDTAEHRGVDFAATTGTEIRATAHGVVGGVTNDKTLGQLVTLNHGYGYSTRYGHCETILVHQGDVVAKGQIIARVGNTGLSTAPHLHYEVRKNGQQVNPMDYISKVQ